MGRDLESSFTDGEKVRGAKDPLLKGLSEYVAAFIKSPWTENFRLFVNEADQMRFRSRIEQLALVADIAKLVVTERGNSRDHYQFGVAKKLLAEEGIEPFQNFLIAADSYETASSMQARPDHYSLFMAGYSLNRCGENCPEGNNPGKYYQKARQILYRALERIVEDKINFNPINFWLGIAERDVAKHCESDEKSMHYKTAIRHIIKAISGDVKNADYYFWAGMILKEYADGCPEASNSWRKLYQNSLSYLTKACELGEKNAEQFKKEVEDRLKLI